MFVYTQLVAQLTYTTTHAHPPATGHVCPIDRKCILKGSRQWRIEHIHVAHACMHQLRQTKLVAPCTHTCIV